MEPWLQLLIQIPLVGAFMWFVLKQQERDAAERNDRQEREAAERKERDAAWQTFLTDQRAATVTALSEVSRELGKVADHLNRLQGTVEQHDVIMREAVHEMRRSTDREGS